MHTTHFVSVKIYKLSSLVSLIYSPGTINFAWPFIFTPISDTFLQKSRYATILPQKSQQKIKIRYHSSTEESAKKSRYDSTLPQKSQQKFKIPFHSFAEESAKNQDMLPLFHRRVSLSVMGLTHIPPQNICLMGLTHIPHI